MNYSDLYQYIHSLPNARLSRNVVKSKVAQLCNREHPAQIQIVGFNVQVLRGLFIECPDSAHPMAGRCKGQPLILVARDQSESWKRFVTIKELMHYFDERLELVGTAELFEELVEEIASDNPRDSIGMISENKAYWRALALYCNEERRQSYQRALSAGEIGISTIAQELGLPEEIGPALFHTQFRTILDDLLRC